MFKTILTKVKQLNKKELIKDIAIKAIITVIFLTIVYFLFITPITKIYSLNNDANALTIQIAELQKQKEELESEISQMEKINNDLTIEANNSQSTIIETQNKIVDNLDNIANLKNKYLYLFEYRKTHPNADFGINELIHLNDVCTEKNVPVALMLALYEHESGFNSLAKNPSSTATGYGQLINTTARSMYNRLSRGNYDIANHRSVATNKNLNIDLSVELMHYNLVNYKTIEGALNAYYGHPDPNELSRYTNDIINRMSKYQ